MNRVVLAEEMKNIDRYTIETVNIPSLVLMERAAYSVYETIKKIISDKTKVLILCGTGNNGADGLAVSRMLYNDDYDVDIFIVGNIEKSTKQFIQQYEIVKNLNLNILSDLDEKKICSYDILVDAIFGVGLKREVEGRYKEIIDFSNKSKAVKISVDIPSGLCADTGEIMGTVFFSDYTVTFGAVKAGMLIYKGIECCGEIIINNIGIPKLSFEKTISKSQKWFLNKEDLSEIPKRKLYSNKGTYKKVLVIAGSRETYGAAFLCAKSAYKSGAGLVKVLTEESNKVSLQKVLPEILLKTYKEEDVYLESFCDLIKEEVSWADIICLGPGVGTFKSSEKLVLNVLNNSVLNNKKLVIDADAINIISKNKELLVIIKNKEAILTPHLMEMSRLTDIKVEDIRSDLINCCERFADENGVICLLKDSHSVISDGHNTYINVSGNAAMAKGGSGDVLAGIISGLLAIGLDPLKASVFGAYVSGVAGERASEKKGIHSMLASDIIDEIGGLL